MKKTWKRLMLAAMLMVAASPALQAEHLIIMSANDTHSQIEPASDGKSGVLRRLAAYDQARRENKNVLVVHAGDAVQGTNYFSLYGGKVEYSLLDSLHYDIVVLGNHEFDNGIDSLAYYYKNVKATKLSTNYDFSDTKLAGEFQPWVIKTYGDKRVGFIGLNVNPVGMVADGNFKGLRYLNPMDVADATAKYLKEIQKVDYAVMISHIGYDSMDPNEPNDSLLVTKSHYIDFVIGGHSHTVLKPGSQFSNVLNADGKVVVIGQNGKSGKYVGKYDLDLETGEVIYSLVDIDSKLDAAASQYTSLQSWLAPFKHGVDSLMNNPVGQSVRFMKNDSWAAQNWICDAVMQIIPKLTKQRAQFAIMNKGGIRVDMPKGVVTEGLLGSMFPFDNRFVILNITGKDLLEALKVMAYRDGDAVSKELKVAYNAKKEIVSAKLNGKEIKPNKTYQMLTIDFLANGGDYLNSFKNCERLFVDDVKYGSRVLDYVKELTKQGKMIDSTDEARMYLKK